MDWIKCEEGHMPENDDRYMGKEVINVLVTTDRGIVTKIQRRYDIFMGWYWTRIRTIKAWMPLPDSYKGE